MRTTDLLAVLLLAPALGCGMRRPAAPEARPPASGVRIANLPSTSSDNLARLERLAAERQTKRGEADYVLGEGDLLSVRAVGMDELTPCTVAGDGTITLPLLTRSRGRKTLDAAAARLTTRLGAYCTTPSDTRPRGDPEPHVGVVGSVQRPGW